MRQRLWWWGSRLGLAVAAPLIVFGGLELAVRLAWGPIEYPLPGLDQAAEYLQVTMPERFSPLFELQQDDDGPHFHSVPTLYTGNPWFGRKQRFPARRAPNAVRIAFVGGSSVQGWPWRPDGVVFPELVAAILEQRHPGLEVDWINAGVGTYSSFQIVEVAWQLSALSPDVVVVYAGHNDRGYCAFNRGFLDEAADYGRRGHRDGLLSLLNRLQFYRGARMWRDSRRPPEEVRIEDPGQLFQAQEARRSGTAGDPRRFVERVQTQEAYLPLVLTSNLGQALDQLGEQTTPVLALPAGNLRDFPPHFSMFFEPLERPQQERFVALVRQAAELMERDGVGPREMPGVPGDGSAMHAGMPWAPASVVGGPEPGSAAAAAACKEPLRLLDEAARISDTYALAWFLRGTCLVHSDPTEAREALVRASDLSPALAPHQRASTPMVEAIRVLASDRDLPLVDVPRAFEAVSEYGIPDGHLFVDSLHFSELGHRIAAEAIADTLDELPVIRDGPSPDRTPDPAPDETVRRLAERERNPRWGLDLPVPGVSRVEVEPEQTPESVPVVRLTRADDAGDPWADLTLPEPPPVPTPTPVPTPRSTRAPSRTPPRLPAAVASRAVRRARWTPTLVRFDPWAVRYPAELEGILIVHEIVTPSDPALLWPTLGDPAVPRPVVTAAPIPEQPVPTAPPPPVVVAAAWEPAPAPPLDRFDPWLVRYPTELEGVLIVQEIVVPRDPALLWPDLGDPAVPRPVVTAAPIPEQPVPTAPPPPVVVAAAWEPAPAPPLDRFDPWLVRYPTELEGVLIVQEIVVPRDPALLWPDLGDPASPRPRPTPGPEPVREQPEPREQAPPVGVVTARALGPQSVSDAVPVEPPQQPEENTEPYLDESGTWDRPGHEIPLSERLSRSEEPAEDEED